MPRKRAPGRPGSVPPFNLDDFLETAGRARAIQRYRRAQVIFSQGTPADNVLYIQNGRVKLSVLSRAGKEAVIAMLGAGDFFGEGCLAGQPRRMATASALSATTLLVVEKSHMLD